MKTFRILADDLSGACDTGLEFYLCGCTTHIRLVPGPSDAEALVLDSESRNINAQSARTAVRRLLQAENMQQEHVWFKKIDSTLRGNIAVELDELRQHKKLPVIFTPAFPGMGRTVEDGLLLVKGVPVHETFMGCDPQSPVTSALTTQAAGGGVAVHRDALHDPARLGPLLEAGECLCCDARDDEDLRALVRCCLTLRQPEGMLWAGSAGLASALTDVLFHAKADSPHPTGSRSEGPQAVPGAQYAATCLGRPTRALLMIGSVNPVSREQARLVLESGNAEAVRLDMDALLRNPQQEAQRIADTLCAGLRADKHALLVSMPPEADGGSDALKQETPPASTAAKAKRVPAEHSQAVALLYGKVAALVLHHTQVGSLFVTGGEIAVHCLRELSCTQLKISGAVDVGIPCVEMLDGTQTGLPLVIKAGGFGAPTLLRDLYGT